ncbi:MAG: right-handed parallel beta-helix repeat-containing protein [Phycisphaerales bacterium]|nr:MAG: right-handed parallel beta-helix repeat-containing protein [Phycisphaerales bacterium]
MWKGHPKTYLAVSVFLMWIGPMAYGGHVIYVDCDAIGADDGVSWASAYNHLQDALAYANSLTESVEIRIAQGTYTPDQGVGITPGDQEATFQVVSGVKLKGGYAGFGEPDPDVRNAELYETVLSGDLEQNDTPDPDATEDNSCYVVKASYADQSAMLDGLTITGRSPYPRACKGEGMFQAAMLIDSGSPTILNCLFSGCDGFGYDGAIVNLNGSSPKLSGCTFTANDNSVLNVASSPTLTRCVFKNNSGAGVASTEGSSPTISACVFEDNSRSGVASEGGSNLVVTNCTFERNDTGVSGRRSSLTIADCTFKNNRDFGAEIHGCQSTLTNCVFDRNGDGRMRDGGIDSYGSNLNLVDCAFTRNSEHAIDERSGSLTLTRCLFENNVGYSAIGLGGDATLYDCTFRGNHTEGSGAAIYATGNLVLYNCRFSGNSARRDASAISAHRNFTAVGCVFSGNSVEWFGGAVDAGRAVLSNCTFIDNRELGNDSANAIEHRGSSPSSMKLTHCIIRNGDESIRTGPGGEASVAVTYSNIQGGWPGEGNIDEDPLFIDHGYWADANETNAIVEPNDPNAVWIDGDYHLQSKAGRWDAEMNDWVRDEVSSPCIDAGNPGGPVGPEPFPNGGVVNMGAYGGTTEASKSYFAEPVCETIVAGDINGDCQVDSSDFALLACHWLQRGQDFVNAAPTVRIVAPVDGAEFNYPTPIAIRAEATDADGSVVWLHLTMSYRSNGRSTTVGRPGDEIGGSWWYQWYWWQDTGSPFEGNYTITAKASDDDCAVSVSAPVVVTLRVP